MAGTENWTKTLALELKKNHEVACYSPLLGVISRQLETKGIECFCEAKGEYDAIIANHWPVVNYLREKYPQTPIISTIHGIGHLWDENDWMPEHPAAKVNQFVAVSEEVQKKLKDDYNLDSVIIRNFFEIEPLLIHVKPKKFLFISNNETSHSEIFKLVEQVAEHYRGKLSAIGGNFIPVVNVRDFIKSADVVIGVGRSVMEGVAMGRLGIVHGQSGTGGAVCKEKIEQLRYYNFSGRNYRGRFMTVEEMIKEINEHYGEDMIPYMRENHEVEKAAKEYLKLCKSLV